MSYNMDVNGKTIPVVGYVTKMTNQALPSVASNLKVTEETDHSITIAWENGIRPAHHFDVYRVDVVKKENDDRHISVRLCLSAVIRRR